LGNRRRRNDHAYYRNDDPQVLHKIHMYSPYM
jgi:hypothetical protein